MLNTMERYKNQTIYVVSTAELAKESKYMLTLSNKECSKGDNVVYYRRVIPDNMPVSKTYAHQKLKKYNIKSLSGHYTSWFKIELNKLIDKINDIYSDFTVLILNRFHESLYLACRRDGYYLSTTKMWKNVYLFTPCKKSPDWYIEYASVKYHGKSKIINRTNIIYLYNHTVISKILDDIHEIERCMIRTYYGDYH